MTRTVFLSATLVSLLAGCDPAVKIGDPDAGAPDGGPSDEALCNRAFNAQQNFFAGRTSCHGTSTSITPDSDPLNHCLSGIVYCSAPDRAVLDSLSQCHEQAPRCTPGNEDSAINATMGCVSTALPNLSPMCRSALVRVRPAGKRVFITQEKFMGNLGGLSGADALCTTAATSAGLNGSWKAWLSSSTVNAIDRMVDVGPWVDIQGATVFTNKSSLLGGPSQGLWIDETGNFLSSDPVWTATGSDGRFMPLGLNQTPCENWTSASTQHYAEVGQVGRTQSAWTSYSATNCSQLGHLICFEQ